MLRHSVSITYHLFMISDIYIFMDLDDQFPKFWCRSWFMSMCCMHPYETLFDVLYLGVIFMESG